MILAELFIPHGHCYLWKPGLVALHITSNALTALAYYSIPLTLIYFAIKRRDVPFNWIFLLFGAFIISCGTGHVMDIWTLWHPNYWLSGCVKAFTAIVSLYTAGELGGLLPQALAIPSAAQFEAVKNEIQERLQAEAALRESEERFRQLTENIHQVFWMVSIESFQILYVSPAYEKIWQRSSLSLYEQPNSWFDAIHPEDKQRVIAAHQHIQSGDYNQEYRIVRPDGSIRWIGSRAFPICNERGEVYRIAGISEDITERKQVEEALGQSAAMNSALLNAIPDMIFRCHADGTFLDFKPAKDITTIVPPSVFIGKKVQEVLPPELVQRVLQAQERAIRSGETQILEYQLVQDDQVSDYEARIVARDRHEIISIVRDITDRKRTESALRQQKGLLQTIFDHIPVMICFFDANGQILLLNREFEQVMGWSLAQVKDIDLMAQCYPDPEYRAQVWDFMLAATGKWQDFKVRTRYGSYIDSSWATIRLSDGTAIGIGSDITHRKMAEEALRSLTQQEREKAQQLEQALKELTRTQAQLIQNEKMVSLGQLVAGIAHEINNPTSFIYGNIYAADDYARDLLHLIELYTQHYPEPVPEIAQYIERIDLNFLASDFPNLLASMKEGARRITEIVQSLRNFSRLDEMDCKSVNIHEGIDNTLLILKHRLMRQSKRPEIQVIKEYGELPRVECYPGQLNQVFMNIINNAIDALEDSQGSGFRVHSHEQSTMNNQHSPVIRIQTEVLEQKWVVIRIADNGDGIQSELQHRIFDPFFTTKPVGQGTGLGLSISYHIVVDRHKGQLTCYSVPGQGAEFVIKLSLARCCGKLSQCTPIKPTSECSPATPSHPAVRTATNE
jgi:two-component system NtrC family sensor kinase